MLRKLIALLISMCAVLLAGSATADPRRPSAIMATAVHVVADAGATSVIVDLSAPQQARVAALADPDRLLLDLSNVSFHAPADRKSHHGGLVKALRFGVVMTAQSRIVIDLVQPARVVRQDVVSVADGVRLVIRLEPVAREAFLANAGASAWSRTDGDDIVTGTVIRRVNAAVGGGALPLVVLDPGHGGIDPGASTAAGDLEKTIVLQVAMLLRDRLERGGKVRVAMTRTADVFVPLRDRVRMARQAKAHLFVSLHADSLTDESEVRGATVYTLAERASDERSAKLADRENRADLAAGIDLKDDQDEVSDILFDLARRETRIFSHEVARGIVSSVQRATPMHKNPHRGAGFRVLRAPDVPSVLLELGYLSSAEDVKAIMSDTWRTGMIEAVARAIEDFVTQRLSSHAGGPRP
jgi:N-acetylmuramoyl-L-alanine amidase